MKRIRRLFQPPDLGEPDLNRRAKLLHAIILVLLLFTIGFELFYIIVDPANWLGKVAAGFGFLVELAGLATLRRGRLNLAATGMTLLLWLTMMAVVYLWSGITGAATLGQLLVILMSGLLVNEGAALLLTFLTIGGNYFVMMIENTVDLPFAVLQVSLPEQWLSQSIYLLVAAGFTQAYVRNLRTMLSEAKSNEQVLKDRVTELRVTQIQLETSDKNLRRREAILESIGIAAEKLFRGKSFGESVQHVLKDLGQATGVDRVYIFENHLGDDSRQLSSQRFEWAAEGVKPQIGNAALQSLDFDSSGFARWPGLLRRNLIINNHVKDLPESERELLLAQGILSILIVPILLGEEWWGFIGFDETKWERDWSPAEEDALRGAAGILAGAIERRRAERALNQSEARYLAILQDQQDMICRFTPEGLITFANDAYKRYFGISAAQMTNHMIWAQLQPRDVEALRAKIDSLTPANPTAISQNRNASFDGQFRWVNWTDRGIFDENGQLIEVQAVGRDIEEEWRLRKQLEESLTKMEAQAMTDPLTGLLNRRAIMEHAEAEWQRASRENRPLSLVLMDVDRLKEINDTFGHLAGDEALNGLAELMRAGTRRYDWVGRWGGDEFLLVLPGTDLTLARTLADRLRMKFKENAIHLKDGKSIELHMSLGVASKDHRADPNDTLANLLARADQALYKAKQGGRDRVA
jgi:diguanylate cyclase (GGDEF)-like protein/PAS domain S-box-containing protein